MASGDETADDGGGVADEAARWVARLASADASQDDRRAFDVWRSASPDRAAAFDELWALWSDLKVVRPEAEARRKSGKKGLLALALAAALGTALFQSGMMDRWRADHATAVGEVRTVTLPDGTVADLDTDSAISLDFSQSERGVRLIRGQAFFTVAKDEFRPFVARSDGLTATALGTRFEIDSDRDRGPEVEVEEGGVEVAAGDRRLKLGPGDSAGRRADGRLERAELDGDMQDETAWRRGRLVFSGRRLDEVLTAIGRYRRGPILVLDGRAAALRVSGAFDVADTDAALRSIAATLPVRVSNLAGVAVLVRSAD